MVWRESFHRHTDILYIIVNMHQQNIKTTTTKQTLNHNRVSHAGLQKLIFFVN